MTAHLTKTAKVNIVHEYADNLTPMIKLAERYGVTRQSIRQIIRKAGVDTSKKGPIAVSCVACGKEIYRYKSRLRNTKNQFCGYECYYAYLDASQQGEYKYWRWGQSIARSVAGKYIELSDGYIVHHIDRNTRNNHYSNLMVFANQGDHVRFHRLGAEYSRPLWDGSKI